MKTVLLFFSYHHQHPLCFVGRTAAEMQNRDAHHRFDSKRLKYFWQQGRRIHDDHLSFACPAASATPGSSPAEGELKNSPDSY